MHFVDLLWVKNGVKTFVKHKIQHLKYFSSISSFAHTLQWIFKTVTQRKKWFETKDPLLYIHLLTSTKCNIHSNVERMLDVFFYIRLWTREKNTQTHRENFKAVIRAKHAIWHVHVWCSIESRQQQKSLYKPKKIIRFYSQHKFFTAS